MKVSRLKDKVIKNKHELLKRKVNKFFDTHIYKRQNGILACIKRDKEYISVSIRMTVRQNKRMNLQCSISKTDEINFYFSDQFYEKLDKRSSLEYLCNQRLYGRYYECLNRTFPRKCKIYRIFDYLDLIIENSNGIYSEKGRKIYEISKNDSDCYKFMNLLLQVNLERIVNEYCLIKY